jgi:hypothetical protein
VGELCVPEGPFQLRASRAPTTTHKLLLLLLVRILLRLVLLLLLQRTTAEALQAGQPTPAAAAIRSRQQIWRAGIAAAVALQLRLRLHPRHTTHAAAAATKATMVLLLLHSSKLVLPSAYLPDVLTHVLLLLRLPEHAAVPMHPGSF